MLDLSPIYDMVVDAGTKGLPTGAGPMRLADIGRAGWRLHSDLQLPAAVLRRSAIDNNGDYMRRFAERFRVALCPHGKTTMAPQLFDRQLRDGAWGLSSATISNLQVYRRFGVQRIIHANQIVSRPAAIWLARELAADPTFEVYVFVDSEHGADLLAGAALEVGLDRPIAVLLEIGIDGGRTGVRSLDAALQLAGQVSAHPGLSLAGVATFEGIVAGRTDAEMEPNVQALFDDTVRAAEAIARARLFAPSQQIILSAGGSRFFDMAAISLSAADVGSEPLVVLRSGCYISHDAHHYEVAFRRLLERNGNRGIDGRLMNALEVWADIQSWPEAGWLFANLGKRDVSHDIDLPHVIASASQQGPVTPVAPGTLTVAKLSDQHAHIVVNERPPLAIGDQLGFGVSHPCTTFDKWRTIFEVDDDGLVVDAIATFF